MNDEHERLHLLLREWTAPEPSSALDADVLAAFCAAHRTSRVSRNWLRRIWTARITLPVPALAAALLLIAAVLWFQFRPASPISRPAIVNTPDSGYTTRIEAAGFKPLPDGDTRVIRSEVRH